MEAAWFADLLDETEFRSSRIGELACAKGVPALDPSAAPRIRVGDQWLDEVLASLWGSLGDVESAVAYARLRLHVRLLARARAVRTTSLWPCVQRERFTASTVLVGPVRVEPPAAVPWARIGRTAVAGLFQTAVDRIRRYERPEPDDWFWVQIHLRKIKFQPKTIRRAMHRSLGGIAGEWLVWWMGREAVFVKHLYRARSWWQVLLHDPETGGSHAPYVYRLHLALASGLEDGSVRLLVLDQEPWLYWPSRREGGDLAGRWLVHHGLLTPEEWGRYGRVPPAERPLLAQRLRRLELVEEALGSALATRTGETGNG